MNDKKKCEIPEYVIDSMARALLPAILEFYSVEENRQAFEKWKADQNDSLKQIEKKWQKKNGQWGTVRFCLFEDEVEYGCVLLCVRKLAALQIFDKKNKSEPISCNY